jgi:hypothetical protein
MKSGHGGGLFHRFLRSGGFIRSRSASELLLTQKTKLPCLTAVCLGAFQYRARNIFHGETCSTRAFTVG